VYYLCMDDVNNDVRYQLGLSYLCIGDVCHLRMGDVYFDVRYLHISVLRYTRTGDVCYLSMSDMYFDVRYLHISGLHYMRTGDVFYSRMSDVGYLSESDVHCFLN